MPSRLSFTLIDHGSESTTVTIPTANVNAANYDAVFGDLPTQSKADLEAAINGVTTGFMNRITGVSLEESIAGAAPADPWSQRELGLRVWGRGQVSGKLYSITIGTADLVALAPGTDDVVSLANAAMATLVTALEDHWQPTYDGAVGTTETIVVERAQVVGRSN